MRKITKTIYQEGKKIFILFLCLTISFSQVLFFPPVLGETQILNPTISISTIDNNKPAEKKENLNLGLIKNPLLSLPCYSKKMNLLLPKLSNILEPLNFSNYLVVLNYGNFLNMPLYKIILAKKIEVFNLPFLFIIQNLIQNNTPLKSGILPTSKISLMPVVKNLDKNSDFLIKLKQTTDLQN
ncbi:MAG: hypothetical protein NC935_08925, partial [Candidatus Omnitrophica bacterium]|nr:hypothetical protein [Candidatus Omnitrophota bacterium]